MTRLLGTSYGAALSRDTEWACDQHFGLAEWLGVNNSGTLRLQPDQAGLPPLLQSCRGIVLDSFPCPGR